MTNCPIRDNVVAGGGVFGGNVTNFGNTIVAGNASTAGVDIGAYEFNTSFEDITDKTSNEETLFLLYFDVGDAGPGAASVTATSDNQALIPDANITVGGGNPVWLLRVAPAANLSGVANITVTVNFTNGVTVNDSFQLTVLSVNDAPSFTKGADQTVAKATDSSGLDSQIATVSLTVTAVNEMTFAGTQTDLNAALSGLAFKPTAGFIGSASIQINTNDQGSTGSGGARTDTDFVGITVKTSIVEFTQTSYTAVEGGGALAVVVTRTGNASESASVAYQRQLRAGRDGQSLYHLGRVPSPLRAVTRSGCDKRERPVSFQHAGLGARREANVG